MHLSGDGSLIDFSTENNCICIQKFSVDLDFVCIYGYNIIENKAIYIQKFSVEVKLWSSNVKIILISL